jgi:hypothetical protein
MKSKPSSKGAKAARRKVAMVSVTVSIPAKVNSAAVKRGEALNRTRKRVLSEAICHDFGVDLDKLVPVTRMQKRKPWTRPAVLKRPRRARAKM